MNLGIEDACWLAWLISQRREHEYSRLRVETARTVLKQTHQIDKHGSAQEPGRHRRAQFSPAAGFPYPGRAP